MTSRSNRIATVFAAPPAVRTGSSAMAARARLFGSLPIGDRPTHLLFSVPRVECHARAASLAGSSIDFADPRRRYTHAFERYALGLSEHMTIKDVADHLGVGWDAVKDIHENGTCKSVSRSPSSSTCDCWPSTRSPSAAWTSLPHGGARSRKRQASSSSSATARAPTPWIHFTKPLASRRERRSKAGRPRHVEGLHPGRHVRIFPRRPWCSTASTSSNSSTTDSATFAANRAAARLRLDCWAIALKADAAWLLLKNSGEPRSETLANGNSTEESACASTNRSPPPTT